MVEVQVLLEKADPNMTEGTITEVTKKEGEMVAVGDVIATVETEKMEVAVEARAAGLVKKVLVKAGDVTPIGGLIAIIETTV